MRAGAADLLEELDRHLVEPLVIVMDDAERLQAVPGGARLLNDLLAARIDRLRVAAATRQLPPLRLAKLRSAGLLTELGPRDLAFTPEECGQLLVASGRSPEERDEERLFAATDGWPLGAALAAAHGDNPAAHGSASRSELFSFLREEVLEALPDALRRKALEVATPREFNAACMRALGLPEQLPKELGERGLVLQPAGSELEWFAFHPLVREFLRSCRDEEFDPPSLLQLHRDVAPALEAAGRREEAIEHLIEGKAWEEATAAIAEVAPGDPYRSGNGTTVATSPAGRDARGPGLPSPSRPAGLGGRAKHGRGRAVAVGDRSLRVGRGRLGRVVGALRPHRPAGAHRRVGSGASLAAVSTTRPRWPPASSPRRWQRTLPRRTGPLAAWPSAPRCRSGYSLIRTPARSPRSRRSGSATSCS